MRTLVTAGLLLGAVAPITAQDSDLPEPLRELRAAWVATVSNMDWPSKPGLSTAKQKEEAIAILDRLASLRMNAVVLQVRPQADALYESRFEPWSYFLTGRQGRRPSPFYDPLEFWIEAAHARGIQLHAWFNPYRANHPSHGGEFARDSVVVAKPKLVVELAEDGYLWMDPSLPEVQDHTVSVVLDVVERYAVDGIHFDDYFYPYPSYNGGADFPDDASYAAYRKGGGRLSRGDWRRQAVDTLIARLYAAIKKAAPHVEFGISPFGIWRPGHPEGIEGLDQYDVLYADARKWLREGHVDYLTPQLYWPIARIAQSFPVLLGWWQEQNVVGRHLWPGTSLHRARGQAGATEILNQVMITRGMLRSDPGLCMFSAKSLMGDGSALVESLREGCYARPALIPSSPWLDAEPPAPPRVRFGRTKGRAAVRLEAATPDTFLFVVYEKRGERWSYAIVPAVDGEHVLGEGVERIAVSAVDRSRNEGERVEHALD